MSVRSELSAYLLGELDAAERAAFEAALAADPGLRAEVERLRPVVSRLDALPAEAWEEIEAPPLALPAAAVPEAAAPAAPRERRRRRIVLRPAFAALLAAALLAGGVGIGALIDDGGSSAPPVASTLPLAPLANGTGAHGNALVADGGAKRVTLRLRGLPQSRPGQFYEVWLMDADGPLIALGSFRVGVGAGGGVTIELPLPVPATDYQYFDVSVQPEGDDANHSGDSVLRGRTSA